MEERTIIRITLTVTLIGIFLILLMGEITEMPLSKISELENKELESRIRIEGKILSVRKLTGAYLININDGTSTMPAVVFEENLDLNKGSEVELRGKLSEYNRELEMIVDTIKVKRKI